jgi:hypothetical protein
MVASAGEDPLAKAKAPEGISICQCEDSSEGCPATFADRGERRSSGGLYLGEGAKRWRRSPLAEGTMTLGHEWAIVGRRDKAHEVRRLIGETAQSSLGGGYLYQNIHGNTP